MTEENEQAEPKAEPKAEPQAGAAAQKSGPSFLIHKIYVKDLSLECPNSPSVFMEKWDPDIKLDIESVATAVGQDNHEVVLKITVTAKTNDQFAYLVEVQQAGIFHLGGFREDQLEKWTATFCANILFPYVRETISDVVVRAGFPQLLLAPVNFDALYADKQAAKTAETASGGE